MASFPLYGWAHVPGLDYSYIWGLNYAAEKGFQFGRDVVFTFGPLGYLLFPQTLGNNLETGMVFTVAYRLGFALLLAFTCLKSGSGSRRLLWLKALIGFIILKIATFDAMVLAAVGCLALFTRSGSGRLAPFIMGAMVGVLLLFKTVPALPALTIAGLALLPYPGSPSRLAYIGVVLGGMAGSIIVLAGTGFSFSALCRYVIAWKEFSVGASSVSSSAEPNAWLATAAAGLCVIVSVVVALRSRPGHLPLIILVGPTLYIYFKYAYSRMDHAILFPPVVAVLLLTQALLASRVRDLVVHFAVAVSAVFFLQAGIDSVLGKQSMVGGYKAGLIGQSLQTNGFANFYESVIRFNNYKKELQAQSKANLRPLKFSDAEEALFVGQSVDSYPFELSPVAANDLCWRPRPIFQSQQGLTPWADRLNAEFFRAGRGADMMLFDQRIMEGIDTRYLLSEEPHTILEILGRYEPIALIDHYQVMMNVRGEMGIDAGGSSIERVDGEWERWIEPPSVKGILRAKVRATQPVLRKIKRLLYKQAPVFIEYNFADGSVKKHRLVVDNMGEGVWVAPYLTSLEAKQVVDKIRFRDPDSEFEKRLTIEWVEYSVSQDWFLAKLLAP